MPSSTSDAAPHRRAGRRGQPPHPDECPRPRFDRRLRGHQASNADAAIAILEARSDVKLVFTDIEMPGSIDGAKLAHYIRNRWPPIHLIVASGKEIRKEARSPPARPFAKPYDNNTIVEEMARMLALIGVGDGGRWGRTREEA